jgi:hypothetical protein
VLLDLLQQFKEAGLGSPCPVAIDAIHIRIKTTERRRVSSSNER